MVTSKRMLLLLLVLLFVSVCNSQNRSEDRQPAVAGQFYPGRPDELKRTLDELFSKAVAPRGLPNVITIIVPHAGYVYSGEVAASGFNQIDPNKQYDNIFVLGPSHHVGFEGASVYCSGNFITPLGTVEVNRKLGEELTKKNPMFTQRMDAHAYEHSVEVEIPFLQHHLKKHFRIVPIVLGANRPETCRKIGETLRPYLNEKNLFVISTDFSHYPKYEDAVKVDKATAEAIVSNSPENLMKTIRRYEESGMPNLATSLCGVSGVLTLLYMTSPSTDVTYYPIQYKNSGDAPSGGKEHVVGYYAIAVTKQAKLGKASFELDSKEKTALLAITRRAVERYIRTRSVPEVDPATLSDTLKTPCGAFVTLNKRGMLRGCIGRFDTSEPLYKVVQEMAVASATQDYRFKPVEESEIKDLEIEISVLTPMRKISSIAEFQLGKHGIYIRKGSRSGTFLPQVAQETGWTKEEFLGHCAQDKAGIGWEGWKDAELYVYEALVFGEK
ncbi:MAG: AmmeMemoRadiSam system protein B [Thermodesulfobacteriota bacterium]